MFFIENSQAPIMESDSVPAAEDIVMTPAMIKKYEKELFEHERFYNSISNISHKNLFDLIRGVISNVRASKKVYESLLKTESLGVIIWYKIRVSLSNELRPKPNDFEHLKILLIENSYLRIDQNLKLLKNFD